LKIAVNTRLLLPNRMEGIARYNYENLKRMVLANPTTEFHFIFDRQYDSKFLFADNITPHIAWPPSRHPILWYYWFEITIPTLLKKIGADVFFSGDMYLSLKTEIPTLMVSHDLNYEHYPQFLKWSHRQYMLHYSKKFHKKANHLIAVSKATKQDIINTYNIPENKISVAYNAAPLGFLPLDDVTIQKIKSSVTGGMDYFIYVGSLHPRKNVDGLLKAFDTFKKSSGLPHKLVVFGRKAFKTGQIFNTYNALQYKKDVLFVSDDVASLTDMLAAATALCYVSYFEGFGIPILEAFHAETPVITSNVSSMPEVAGDAALLVDPNDTRNIANAMNKVAMDSHLRTDLIAKGKLQREKFSWDKSADLIYNCLTDLI